MVKVYVDEREKNSGIPEILSNLGITVIYRMLEVGDYVINDSLIIERKRVDDLIRSVFDGRFFEQVGKLSEACEVPMLIVEGDLDEVRQLTHRWKAIEGALITAVVKFRVTPYYTRGSEHTAEVIKYIAEKFGSKAPLKSYQYFRRYVKLKTDDIRSRQLYVLQSLPGVGVKTAHKLLEKFGTLRAIFNASQSELSMVEGISEGKASKIIKVITEPYVKKPKGSSGLSRYVDDFTKN